MAPSTPFPSPTVFTLQRPHPRASLPRQPRILGPGREGGDRQTYLVCPSPPPASEAGSSPPSGRTSASSRLFTAVGLSFWALSILSAEKLFSNVDVIKAPPASDPSEALWCPRLCQGGWLVVFCIGSIFGSPCGPAHALVSPRSSCQLPLPRAGASQP